MCGITGFIQLEQNYSVENLRSIVHKMNEQIIHRGPDSEGLYADRECALGMRRLSIIDLQGGGQPIWNETHDKLIVFNGELYNFRPLRQELIKKGHRFSTDSDTEVMLHGYEEYGTDFLKQAEGMFAFAIYDLKQKVWVLARDRIGEKPLYYYRDGKNFLFASELKSLVCTGIVPKQIDKEALSRYFQLTYIPAPKSIFKNVYKLPPACVMRIDLQGNISTEPYWQLDIDDDNGEYEDYEACKKKLRNALFASVERRMISDVPIGAFLSGGFDSGIIVGIMSQLSQTPINTFTIGFKEKQFDESPLAEIVAKKNHTNHRVLMLDWNETFKDIDKILENIDEPFADSSLIATYAVSKMARQCVTVTLTGDAGDELFAGYNKYLISYYSDMYKKVPKPIRKGVIEPFAGMLPKKSSIARKVNKVLQIADSDIYEQRKRLMSLGFKENEVKELLSDAFADPMDFIREDYEFLKNADEQKRAQYIDLKTVLEGDMLAKVDRASMLNSLETRVPMLDREVIELAFRMPTKFKIDKKNRKIILKDTFRDLLPEELFHAPKHGFAVPIGELLEHKLNAKLNAYADREYLKRQGIFNAEYIRGMIDSHMRHRENRFSELWAFYVFQNWYERMFQ